MAKAKKAAKRAATKSVPQEEVKTSPYVPQRDKLSKDLNIKVKFELTETQQQILDAAFDKNVKCIIIDGPPGSAKTTTATLAALQLLNARKMGQMVFVRSLVQAKDGQTGYLPGALEDKFRYYALPLFQAMEELISSSDIKFLEEQNRIITYPTSMLRSYNFHNSVLVLDESQNLTLDSLITVTTRAGMFSKLFVIGDTVFQNDLGKTSGFKKFTQIFSDEESQENGFRYFKLNSDDIVRSPFVQFVVKKIEEYNAAPAIKPLNGDYRPGKNGKHLVLENYR